MKPGYFKSKTMLAAALSLGLLGTGCAKINDFGDQNTRTDASSIPLTSGLITSAESQIGGLMTGLVTGLRASLYAQQVSEEQYTEQSTYANPQLDFGNTYAGPMMDLQKVIDLNTNPDTKSTYTVLSSGSNGNQLGVAKILKAYWLWTLTDRWGDVPNTEAMKGLAILSPKYDKQQDIYDSLFSGLKSAISSFDAGAAVKGDYLYGGSAAKWKKLANSLRMLIALRMSKVYPAAGERAAIEFVAAATDPNGAITTNADNLVATYDGKTAIGTNVWYNTLNGRQDYDLSLTLSNILTNMSDPRRNAYGTTGSAMPYGLTRDLAIAYAGSVNGSISRPFAVRATTTPVVILPAAYVLLAQAEAVERGWWTTAPSSAQALYEAGVTASFNQWNIAGAAAYLAGAANYNSGTGGGNNIGYLAAYPSVVGADALTSTPLKRIQLQRYLASFGDGIQAWCEWRRTGVPNLKPTAFGTNNPKEIPRRYVYGVNEYGTNTANVAAASALLTGGDIMSARVWWDK